MLKDKIIERIRKPYYRNVLSKAVTIFKPKYIIKIDEKTKNNLNELGKNNFLILPNLLNDSEVTSLREYFGGFKLYDRWRRDLGLFDLDSVSKETHVANIETKAFIENRKIIELANHPMILKYVANYLGCKPVLDTMDAWWSFPGHEHEEEAEYFHRDNDSLKFIKFFIYLTDVDINDGPHTLILGSRNSNKYLEMRKRYSDEEVDKIDKKESWQIFIGKAGTNFIEDTYSLHKGSLPKTGKRLLLQFRYSIYPTIFSSKIPILEPSTSLDKYINQLYLK